MIATPPTWTPIKRQSIPSHAVDFARWLIGKIIVRQLVATSMAGRIIETEAYTSNDEASHSFIGRTQRNQSMFLPAGHAYVYFVYGRYFMLNVSSGRKETGDAVLIRALEPMAGAETMRRNRPNIPDRALTRGPGCLAKALQIDRKLDGIDMCHPGPLWLAEDGYKPRRIVAGTRIGISRNIDASWRFFLSGNPYVSGSRR